MTLGERNPEIIRLGMALQSICNLQEYYQSMRLQPVSNYLLVQFVAVGIFPEKNCNTRSNLLTVLFHPAPPSFRP